MATLDYPMVKFELGNIIFSRETGNVEMEKEYIDTALPQPDMIEVWEEYTVAEQQPVGFKTITQSTSPTVLKHLRFSVQVMKKEDHEALCALNNITPIRVVAAALGPMPVLMYLKRKGRTYPKTGTNEYSFKWTIELVECNDL